MFDQFYYFSVSELQICAYTKIAQIVFINIVKPNTSIQPKTIQITINSPHLLQKYVKLWMSLRIPCHIKQRLENIYKHLLKVLNDSLLPINMVEPWNLNQPDDVVTVQLIGTYPCCKHIPLHLLAAKDRYPVFSVLVFWGLQVIKHLLCNLCQVATMN